eukprot:TRINITY_DN11287_c0_g1_i1.p1 TRINITY_DN11287_c0_g1~~TRINITY_DN11287_c0_g1_i1.p1  ORF type:complete len:803 (+),score=100.74 TRINITY_DN11287_c0_g1_i1:39-2411(+)
MDDNPHPTAVFTWGRGDSCQLGLGSKTSQMRVPTLLRGLENMCIAKLASGGAHNVAVTASGDVFTWGSCDEGQLGHGDVTDQPTPRLLKPMLLLKALQGIRVASVACGHAHTVVIASNGAVYSWGGSEHGQCGHGSTSHQLTPRLVASLHRETMVQVACGGAHTVALSESGLVFSWGRGSNGRLGHGDEHTRLIPTLIEALSAHQLPDDADMETDESTPRLTLVLSGGARHVQYISCGNSHTACITEDGRLFTFGKGADGQLGHGNSNDVHRPVVEVMALQGRSVIAVACGYFHTVCVVAGSRDVYSWGWGEHYQLGHGSTESHLVPRLIESLRNKGIVQIAAGAYHCLALTLDHRAIVWGSGQYGQLGLGSVLTQAEPVVIESIEQPLTSVAAGWWHSVAVCGQPLQPTVAIKRPISLELPVDVYDDDDEILLVTRPPPILASPETAKPDRPPVTTVADFEQAFFKGRIAMQPPGSPVRRGGDPIGSMSVTVLADMWRTDVIPNWDQRRNTEQVIRLTRAGIPPMVRGQVWPLALGNTMGVSRDMFELFVRRARAEARTTSGSGSTSNGSRLIEVDVVRTFPELSLFQHNGPITEHLTEVLQAYACFRPDVGYVQGMSYLAAMLLIYMEPYLAFQCLANLVHRQFLRIQYRMDIVLLQAYFKVYDVLLARYLPQLRKHFYEEGVSPDMYLMEWWLTMFSKVLPLPVVSRVWDSFMLDDAVFLFRTALGLLKLYQQKLVASPFDEILKFVSHLPADINEDALFQAIESIDLSRAKFDALVAKILAPLTKG